LRENVRGYRKIGWKLLIWFRNVFFESLSPGFDGGEESAGKSHI
jgi:hypothetical protein